MISYAKGDILIVDKGIIVHQVNLKGSMGAGIALSNKYPDVYKQYREWVFEAKLGDILFSKINDELYVANLAGQIKYGGGGNKTSYEAYEKASPLLEKFSKDNGLKLYIPDKIGSGLAGGDRDKIHSIMEKHISEIVYVIYP